MQAIQVRGHGSPSVLLYGDSPDPVVASHSLRIRVHAIGVNPVDTYVRSGTYPRLPPCPYVPGGDAAGVVDAIGEAISDFAVGDRVYTAGSAAGLTTGCYAERVVCQEHQVKPLPADVSFEQGAAVGIPYATAYRALFHRAQAEPGESVFIHGASGAVGTAAVQLAAAQGLKVIGSAGTEIGRSRILEDGAHHALDHRSSDYMDQLAAITSGDGPDIILEMAAHLNLDRDLAAIARFGRIVVIGNRGRIEIDPRAAMMKDAVILGLALTNASAIEVDSLHAALYAGLAQGTLRPRIAQTLPLRDAAEAHSAIEEQRAGGKIILLP